MTENPSTILASQVPNVLEENSQDHTYNKKHSGGTWPIRFHSEWLVQRVSNLINIPTIKLYKTIFLILKSSYLTASPSYLTLTEGEKNTTFITIKLQVSFCSWRLWCWQNTLDKKVNVIGPPWIMVDQECLFFSIIFLIL